MYITMVCLFAANIVWAVLNWKAEWVEVVDSVKDLSLGFKIPWMRVLLAPRILLLGIVLFILTILFPPLAMFTGPGLLVLIMMKAWKLGSTGVEGIPRVVLAVSRFGGDLFITGGAATILGFSGFYGSAMALFMSNVLSVVFFIPKRKKKKNRFSLALGA